MAREAAYGPSGDLLQCHGWSGGTKYSAMDGLGAGGWALLGGAHLQYDSSTVVIATHSYSLYP